MLCQHSFILLCTGLKKCDLSVGLIDCPSNLLDDRKKSLLSLLSFLSLKNFYSSFRWTLCSPFWKSPTRDVTSYWQADWTTAFLGDINPPPPPHPPPFWSLIYDEFHVPDVLIVLLYRWRLNSQGYWFKQNQSYQLSMSDSRNYTWQLYKHIRVMQHICSTFACCCCCLSHKFDSTTTTLL